MKITKFGTVSIEWTPHGQPHVAIDGFEANDDGFPFSSADEQTLALVKTILRVTSDQLTLHFAEKPKDAPLN